MAFHSGLLSYQIIDRLLDPNPNATRTIQVRSSEASASLPLTLRPADVKRPTKPRLRWKRQSQLRLWFHRLESRNLRSLLRFSGVFATKRDGNEISTCKKTLCQNRRILINLHGLRVVLSSCYTTRYPSWGTKLIPLGSTFSETPADKLQPAQQVLHQHVHHFR